MNWPARSLANGWTKSNRPIAQANCIASRCPAGASRRNFLLAVVELAKTRKIGDGSARFRLANVQFFWADERCVPPDDTESNFRLANELLFAPLKISESQIHRIRGELPPETAAAQAAAELRRFASSNANGQPVLDLIFLGMGEDGHVASLFPDEMEIAGSDKAVYRAVNNSPKPPPNRITIRLQPPSRRHGRFGC